MTVNILCAGAAQGLVDELEPRFREETGHGVEGHFGAVGAMRERLEAGEPCDVLVTSRAVLASLVEDGRVRADTAVDVGLVHTSVAVRGDVALDVSTPEQLETALRSASELFIPDPQLSTAGIHVASVLQRLGIEEGTGPRFQVFPNGRTAMRALAEDGGEHSVGCTQATEIMATPGLRLVGPLPPPFDLSTVYCAAIPTNARQPDHAARLVELLTGADVAARRHSAGFVPAPPSRPR